MTTVQRFASDEQASARPDVLGMPSGSSQESSDPVDNIYVEKRRTAELVKPMLLTVFEIWILCAGAIVISFALLCFTYYRGDIIVARARDGHGIMDGSDEPGENMLNVSRMIVWAGCVLHAVPNAMAIVYVVFLLRDQYFWTDMKKLDKVTFLGAVFFMANFGAATWNFINGHVAPLGFWRDLPKYVVAIMAFGGTALITRRTQRFMNSRGLITVGSWMILSVVAGGAIIGYFANSFYERPLHMKMAIRLALVAARSFFVKFISDAALRLHHADLVCRPLHLWCVPVIILSAVAEKMLQIGGADMEDSIKLQGVASAVNVLTLLAYCRRGTEVDVFLKCSCRDQSMSRPVYSEEGAVQQQRPDDVAVPEIGYVTGRNLVYSLLVLDFLVSQVVASMYVTLLLQFTQMTLDPTVAVYPSEKILKNGGISLLAESVFTLLAVAYLARRRPAENRLLDVVSLREKDCVGGERMESLWRQRGDEFVTGWVLATLGTIGLLFPSMIAWLCPVFEDPGLASSVFIKPCVDAP